VKNMFDVIVDIDGTIADNSNRIHHIKKEKKDWTSYKNNLHQDKVHTDIVFILHCLKMAGCRLVLCTGRDEEERSSTVQWLKNNYLDDLFEKLYMRQSRDYRPDVIIKKELLDDIKKDGYEPTIVFEDRDGVVNMWRKEGLRCLQVQPGDF
jgi:phosphoglycolate phosphatase-like HAD superfamily hydrolase